jgi:molybdopterin molybdotransferase
MLTIEEARAIIFAEVPAPRAVELPLAELPGATIAEDVASDLDLPPFDKAMMDGYAARAGEPGPWRVIEEIPAGRVPAKAVEPGTCAKIMTGAPMPAGADAVQQVEKTRREGDHVSFLEPVRPGQNVAPRGQDVRRGEIVLRAGRRIGAAEVGALAAVGRTRARVWARPRVAVLAWGDELVLRSPGRARARSGTRTRRCWRRRCGRWGWRATTWAWSATTARRSARGSARGCRATSCCFPAGYRRAIGTW